METLSLRHLFLSDDYILAQADAPTSDKAE